MLEVSQYRRMLEDDRNKMLAALNMMQAAKDSAWAKVIAADRIVCTCGKCEGSFKLEVCSKQEKLIGARAAYYALDEVLGNLESILNVSRY
jgi:hypothetical protein